MDKIKKIRAEIERRIVKYGDSVDKQQSEQSAGPWEIGYQPSGIDTDALMQEVQRYYSENYEYITGNNPTLNILTNIARHFVEWQKEQMMKDAVEGEITTGRLKDELVSRNKQRILGEDMADWVSLWG